MNSILVIDDEPSICWSFEQALTDGGYRVFTTSTAEAALLELDEFAPDVILLDFRLQGMNGLEALSQLRSATPSTPVILMTAFGSLDLAVKALGEGAFDYLPKPFDLDDAVNVVARALASRQTPLAPPALSPVPTDELIGVSKGMQEVFRRIALVAPLDVPVLITGESGVGKELIAQAIHRYSGRDPQRFVPICVPAMSESVLESELFGHVKGSFTGADRDRSGLLAQADGGTAFFDEIGEVPLPLQVKLLRVLEDRKILPVGGNEWQSSSFRLIAATHQSLASRVAAGQFREDLFFRLSVFHIDVPPLRERPEDIPVLAQQFLSQVGGDRRLTWHADTTALLMQRRWRGNVRELRSAVQHAAVVCRGTVITPECLPFETPKLSNTSGTQIEQIVGLLLAWADRQLSRRDPGLEPGDLYERFLKTFERPILEAALSAAGGNQKAAADLLGLHRETLRKRLRKTVLEEDDRGQTNE